MHSNSQNLHLNFLSQFNIFVIFLKKYLIKNIKMKKMITSEVNFIDFFFENLRYYKLAIGIK